MSHNQGKLDRRRFLQNTAAGLGAASVGTSILKAADTASQPAAGKQKIDPNRAQTHFSKVVQKFLLIIVDAHVEEDRGFSRMESPGLFKIIGASIGIPINRYSFESIEFIGSILDERAAEMRRERAEWAKLEAESKTITAPPKPLK